MKRYKIAAWLMIIHGGFMEIGGVLCALPALILGSGKFDIGHYFSFKCHRRSKIDLYAGQKLTHA